MPRKKKTVTPAPEGDARRYRITSGVPLPPPVARPHRYPLTRMKVGDSFGFPIMEQGPVRTAASRYRGRAKSVRFTIRVDKKLKKGRCWRVT